MVQVLDPDTVEQFLRHLSLSQDCSDQTIKAYRADLNGFDEFLSSENLTDVHALTPKKVGVYIARMSSQLNKRTGAPGLAKATIARKLAAASSFMEYLRGHSDENLSNPFAAHRFRWKRHDNPNPVEEYTLDFLLSEMGPRDGTLFRLMVATGLRVSELASLNRDSISVITDIDEEGEEYSIGIGEVVGKGKKLRRFRVDLDTAIRCAEYVDSRDDNRPELFTTLRGTRMSVRAIQERMKHWCEQCGFSHINVHRLRHTFATRMVNHGLSAHDLKVALGHESLGTTSKYFKLEDDVLNRSYHSAMQRARGR